MKNNNKFRLDVWGFITLAMIALYLVFMIYPMGYLKMCIRDRCEDAGKPRSFYGSRVSAGFECESVQRADSLLLQ